MAASCPDRIVSNAAASANILVVGAGGVGCELLKTLALSGFKKMTVIDLDTIDVSNLNRQFLFRKHHVSQPKAICAREAILELRPDIEIRAIHGNVKEAQYDNRFFKSFDAVLNALDNLDARRHVNRMCLSAGVPLLEAGSTGYNGQVMPIIGGATECYECREKPRQRSYPVCTIRSTPEKPEHCVAWGKYLYNLLFGPEDEGNLLQDLKEEMGKLRSSNGKEAARALFRFIFNQEVAKHAAMPGAWEFKQPPDPIDLTAALSGDLDNAENAGSAGTASNAGSSSVSTAASSSIPQQAIWSIQEMAAHFIRTVESIYNDPALGTLCFDKDDSRAMDFVTAAANTRMVNYHISPPLSRWHAQSIAGSIIPAIASTNAIVAGMQVLELLHLFELLHVEREQAAGAGREPEGVTSEVFKRLRGSKFVRFDWVKQLPSGRKIVIADEAEPCNPQCVVCQQALVTIRLDSLEGWSLQKFVDRVLIGALGTAVPLLECANDSRCLYDHEEAEETDTGGSLAAWGITSGSKLLVTDMLQDFQCDMMVVEDVAISADEAAQKAFPDGFEMTMKGGKSAPSDDATPSEESRLERKRAASDSEDPVSKRASPSVDVTNTVSSSQQAHTSTNKESQNGTLQEEAEHMLSDNDDVELIE